jgi:hypothetical protein
MVGPHEQVCMCRRTVLWAWLDWFFYIHFLLKWCWNSGNILILLHMW